MQSPQAAQQMMDSMDLPPQVLSQLRAVLPPELKKWSQLKAWLPNSNLAPPVNQRQLLNLQAQQFRQVLERREIPPAGQQLMVPGGPQPPSGPPQPVQQVVTLPNGVPIPPQVLQVTQQDFDTIRGNPRFASFDNTSLMRIAVRMKQEQFIKRWQQAQLQSQQPRQPHQQQFPASNPIGSLHQPHPGPAPPPPVPQPEMVNAPQFSVPQRALHKPTPTVADASSGGPKSNNNNNNNRAPQNPPQNRAPAPPQPSPATVQKSLKRPMPDDASDVQDATATANQRPNSSQPSARPSGQAQPTPEQLASLTPEQRQKWEQLQRNRQKQQSSEDVNRLKVLSAEEARALASDPMPDILMPVEEKKYVAGKITKMADDLKKVGKGLGKWYAITHDDSRARMFFRTRLRLLRQFHDTEMSQMKDNFSIRSQELDEARAMLESMAKDLAVNLPIPKKGTAVNASAPAQQPAPAAPTQNQPAPQISQPAPLSAANLEKQTQALSKMHNRSNSKSGQPPAAPTTTQPPFQFGAQKSPTGQPIYFNDPPVTQTSLKPPPPARKKAKTGPQQDSSPSIQQPNASPQIKPPSPEVKRQPQPDPPKAPSRPLLVCPEVDCEMHATGFVNQEALDNHRMEEHVKPYEDPTKFVQDSLSLALGLDSQRRPKAPPKAEGSQLSAPPMTTSLSKQGQTPLSKAELVSTPMSREASMKRQGSATGAKGGENKATPGTSGPIRSDNTPRPAEPRIPEIAQAPIMEDAWEHSTIDPQNLFATFSHLEPIAGGVVSDRNIYRSLTPNDTPESSKDSGTSEPNSDISENAQIDIEMNWQPLDADVLLDMDNCNIEPYDNMGGGDFMGHVDSSFQFTSWDDVNNDFSKPFYLDSSLYSMDMA